MPTSTSLLASLPIELCDAIISLISSTKDLLNLALTCRQLCQLIVPDHIEYRQIRCSTSDKFVWEHLLNGPNLAKRVLSVTILDSVTGARAGVHRLIPRKFQMQATDAEAEDLASGLQLKAFTKSIYVMKNLYSFDYSGPCPASLLFIYLAHFSPGLRVFKYNYEWISPDRTPPWHDIIDTTHLNKRFNGLEYFSSNIRFRGEYEAHVSTVVDSLFQNNPSLESLSLFIWDTCFEFPSPMGLLTGVHWPKIHTLSLAGNIIILNEDTDLQLRTSLTQSFFSRHASLEKVRLWGPGIPIYPGIIQSDMLPKLNSLDLDFETTYPVSELIPENVIARLTNLSVNLCNVPDSFITSGHLKNLRKLVTRITSTRIISLLEVISNIERLYIVLDWEFPTDESNKKRGVLCFLPAFTRHVKSLTHLSILLPFHAEDAALGEYARELHKLDYIQFPCTHTAFNPWYRIIRSPSGAVGLERHLEESDEWAAYLWMGFDSSFE